MNCLHHFLNLKGEAYFSREKYVCSTYVLPLFCGFRPFHLNYTNDAKNFMGLKGNLKLVAWNDDGWGYASTFSSCSWMLDLIRDCFVYLIVERNLKFVGTGTLTVYDLPFMLSLTITMHVVQCTWYNYLA